jgi:hypothetical protein
MEIKEVLKRFERELIESLEEWAKYAAKFQLNATAAQQVLPIDVYRVLLQVNDRMDAFRSELRSIYKFYKKLENDYGLKPLSVTYLEQYAILTQNLTTSLTKIKEIAEKYESILEAAKKSKININDHVSTQNQKAIERLLTMDLEILLQILSDNELLGF